MHGTRLSRRRRPRVALRSNKKKQVLVLTDTEDASPLASLNSPPCTIQVTTPENISKETQWTTNKTRFMKNEETKILPSHENILFWERFQEEAGSLPYRHWRIFTTGFVACTALYNKSIESMTNQCTRLGSQEEGDQESPCEATRRSRFSSLPTLKTKNRWLCSLYRPAQWK